MSTKEELFGQVEPYDAGSVKARPGIDKENDDMYDDPSGLEGHGLLATALRVLQKEVSEPYWCCNQEALRLQRWHRAITRLALIAGTTAVLMAILQLPLRELHWFWLATNVPYIEFVAAVLAAGFVIWGLLQGVQKQWLLERHKAERLRFLKYKSILNLAKRESQNNPNDWIADVKREVTKIKDIDETDLMLWLKSDAEQTAQGKTEETVGGKFAEIEDYYRKKRLDKQLRYFARSESKAQQKDSLTKYLPLGCFLISVLCAIVHLGLSSIDKIREPLERVVYEPFLSNVLVELAAIFPVLGAAIRTYRSANEFSRNSVRFGAVRHSLERVEQALSLDMGPKGKLEQLESSEVTLEDEHREWLRLMDEAEWYG